MSSQQEYGAICRQTNSCLRSFEELLKGKRKLDEKSPTFEGLRHAQKRFTDWCGTLAAHRHGPLSLDERLRDASRIRQLVLDCLDGVEEGLCNVKHEDPAWQGNKMMDQSPSIEDLALDALVSSSMIQDPIKHTNAMIDTLFRVTAAVRQPVSVDRYENARRIELKDYQFFSAADGEYLATSKFAKMQPELRERLISASLQRRRFLQYAQDHQNKLAFGLDTMEAQSRIGDPGFSDLGGPASGYEDSVVSYRPPSISVSAIVGQESADDVSQRSSESSFSMASSTVSGHEHRFKMPPFPEESKNGLRTCPCCYLLLLLPNARSWEKHILADLRPFVCTFSECTHDPGKLYSRKGTWFEHELTFHRRRWECALGCSTAFPSQAELRNHLREEHPDAKDIALVQSLLAGREIAANAEAKCPFCLNNLKSRRHMKAHIASHQKQIALRALYSMRIFADESDEESDEEFDRASILSAETAPEVATTSASGETPRAKDTHRVPDPETGSIIVDSSLITRQANAERLAEIMSRVETNTETLKSEQKARPRETQTDKMLNPHMAKRPGKPVQVTRNPSRPLPGQLLRWILVRTFDYTFQSYPGPLCLGQVLLHARDPSSFLLDPAVPLQENFELSTNVQRNVSISKSSISGVDFSALARVVLGISVSVGKLKSDKVSIHAERLESHFFSPPTEYIQRVMQEESLQPYLQRRPLPSSKRLFMVVGIRIAHGLFVENDERFDARAVVEPSVTMESGGGLAFLSLGPQRSTGMSQENHGPTVLAYSLMEIKKSWLGNVMVGPFEKGDIK